MSIEHNDILFEAALAWKELMQFNYIFTIQNEPCRLPLPKTSTRLTSTRLYKNLMVTGTLFSPFLSHPLPTASHSFF